MINKYYKIKTAQMKEIQSSEHVCIYISYNSKGL